MYANLCSTLMIFSPTPKCNQDVWAFAGAAPFTASPFCAYIHRQRPERMWRRPLVRTQMRDVADVEDPKSAIRVADGRLFSNLDNDTLKHQPSTVLGAAVLIAGTPISPFLPFL